jgi:predicted acyltransferase
MLDQTRWGWLTNQWAHRTWDGCTLWDLLQPAFLFFVGLAMPYSYANRQGKGQGWPRQLIHALKRSALLILLGLYLDSYHARHLVFDLRGDLQQIGLAYLLAFLVLPMGMPVQGVMVAFLLIGHTAAYVIHGFAGGHELWNASQNFGVFVDQCLRFSAHREHLVTFNAFSSAAIVLLGILTSGLIRGGLTPGTKVAIMTACSFVGILFGWLLSGGNGWIEYHWFAVIPMIKRLETWTFVFMSVGWTLLIFTYFYLLMDGLTLRAWAMPLILVGRNSLFVYVAFQLFREWAANTAALILPNSPPIAVTLRPLFVELLVMLLFWLTCFWLYRRRIFFKV